MEETVEKPQEDEILRIKADPELLKWVAALSLNTYLREQLRITSTAYNRCDKTIVAGNELFSFCIKCHWRQVYDAFFRSTALQIIILNFVSPTAAQQCDGSLIAA